MTNSQYGVLALILPTLALFAKPISCSLTDAHGIHKQFLVCALATFGISYGSLGLVALLKDPEDHESDFLAWMVMGVLFSFGYTATACVYCMNDALASNYARKNNLSYSKMRIWSCSGWACGALLVMMIGEISWLPFRLPGLIIMVIAIVIDILFLVLWPYEDDFEMFHDGSTVEQRKLSIVGPNTMAYLALSQPRGSISRDMLDKIKAGRSKSVGNLPQMSSFGVPDFKAEFNNNNNSNNGQAVDKKSKKKAKAKKPKEYSNFQIQMILLKMIASSHKSFIRYIGLFILFGVVYGMLFSYQFAFIKAKVAKDDEEFEFMSKFCMIAQSIFGEIPINFIAYDMIKLFGANANMSLALIAQGMRCYFYGHLLPQLGGAWVAIGEALQGPSLGLYWILIVDIGSNYALMVPDFMPELKRRGIIRDQAHEIEVSGCLRASMIGMMSSSMEGFGIALGSFLGGFMSSSLGYNFMWTFCAVISIVVGFANIGWDILTKLVFKRDKRNNATTGRSKKKLGKAIGLEANPRANNMMSVPTITVEDVNSKL